MPLILKQQILSLNLKFQNKALRFFLVLPTISQTYGLSCISNVSRMSPAHSSKLCFPHVWARAILSCFVGLFEIINFLLGSICMQELVFSCMESVFHFWEKFKERMRDVLIYAKLWMFLKLIFKPSYNWLTLIWFVLGLVYTEMLS